MPKIGFIYLAFVFWGPVSTSATDLPSKMKCEVSGSAGCDGEICVGGGIKDASIKLTIFRLSHALILNGIAGTIDNGDGDPYSAGDHSVRWKQGIIAFETYRLSQPQPGLVFLTLKGRDRELEFRCLGNVNAKGERPLNRLAPQSG